MKSKLVPGVYGRVRIFDSTPRLYVKKTNIRTWVVSTSERLTLDSMVSVGGEYHFSTLGDLHWAVAEGCSQMLRHILLHQ